MNLHLSLECFRDIGEACSDRDDNRNRDKYIEYLVDMYNIPIKGFEKGEDQFKRLKTLIKDLKSNSHLLEDECNFVL